MRLSKKPRCIKNISKKMARLCHCEFIQKNMSMNKHYLQTEDLRFNPQNSVNPDSEPSVRVNFTYKTYRKNAIIHRS